jgi:hypothetical protein
MEDMAPAITFMTFAICAAAVLILRPLSTRLGDLLAEMQKARSGNKLDDAELTRMRVAVEHMSNRLELMEERLDFTERLLGNRRETPALPRADERPVLRDYNRD